MSKKTPITANIIFSIIYVPYHYNKECERADFRPSRAFFLVYPRLMSLRSTPTAKPIIGTRSMSRRNSFPSAVIMPIKELTQVITDVTILVIVESSAAIPVTAGVGSIPYTFSFLKILFNIRYTKYNSHNKR